MKNSKLLLILLPIAALLFWYLGRPPAHTATDSAAPEKTAPQKTIPAATTKPPAPPVAAQTATTAFAVAAQEPRSETPPTAAVPAPVADPIEVATARVPVTGNPAIEPEQKIEALRLTFHTYGQRFKGNPVGSNAEITAALAGKNSGQANFIAEGPNAVNDKGELCDGWGTPYFFHQLSGTEMEIRSAGPDKKMWTPDDLVTK